MITLHPKFLIKNGKKQFVVFPYEEFVRIKERMEDTEDWMELSRARPGEAKAATVPLARVKQRLGLKK